MHQFGCRAKDVLGLLILLTLLVVGAPLHAESGSNSTTEDPRFGVYLASRSTGAVVDVDVASKKLSREYLHSDPSVTIVERCGATSRCAESFVCSAHSHSAARRLKIEIGADKPDEVSKSPPSVVERNRPSADLHQNVYYRNKVEFSLDGGWLPVNIPFVFDVFLGDAYTTTSLKYTLVPLIGSLRWQIDDIGGPWILRGNWDLQCSGAATIIPRGPETHYFAWLVGVRRNFVPRHEKIAPYFDGRVGLGRIDAKGPAGVLYAQGQDFTFTVNMGSGVRYNFNSRYSISAGLNWMHISNLYLSQPKFSNYGINVYGPMFGFNVRLGRRRRDVPD